MPTANFDTCSSISSVSDDESSCTITENRNGAGRTESGSHRNLVFGQAPSLFEVHTSVSVLQSLMRDILSPGSMTPNWFYQMLGNSELIVRQTKGFLNVLGAIQMLLRESEFQDMVISLACDKAVWNAVLKNKTVRKFQKSLFSGGRIRKLKCHNAAATEENPRSFTFDDKEDLLARIKRWMNTANAKVMELIERFKEVVFEMFQSPGQGRDTANGDQLDEEVNQPDEEVNQPDEKVKSALLLVIAIFLIVPVIRFIRR